MIFSGKELQELSGPVVYLWYRLGKLMYVGYSRQGLSRPFTNHEHLPDQWSEADNLEIICYATHELGKEAELEMIHDLAPLCNKKSNSSNRDNMKSAQKSTAVVEADSNEG